MSIVLEHTTSLKVIAGASIELNPQLGDIAFEPSRKATLPLHPDSYEATQFAARCSLSLPLHVLVPAAENRRNSQVLHCHVWSGSIPPGSLLRIADEMHVSSPEFSFLQMASGLPHIALIERGYELCGFYGLAEWGWTGRRELPCPLTTPARIRSYLERCGNLPGVRKARRAARYLEGRSRSPRETKLHMSLRLPRALGGQGLDFMRLNWELPLHGRFLRAAGKSFYEIDLFCPHGNVGLEYLGKDFHEGPMRTVGDVRRESILKDMGVEIHDVTKRQSENAQEIIRLAKILSKAHGKQFRTPPPEHLAKTQHLLNALYRPAAH